MKKKSRAPRLKVRQPNKEYKDDSPEHVPVDDITFEDIVKQIDPKNPALKALGISEEQVLKINDATIDAAMSVGQVRYESLDGRWYLPGKKPSEQFIAFVDTYLNTWTGFVKETVFDVNCLVLDEQHVIFSGYNKSVFDFCEQHGITPIISELRHKYFWDGGISCVTQDLRRRGNLETYL